MKKYILTFLLAVICSIASLKAQDLTKFKNYKKQNTETIQIKDLQEIYVTRNVNLLFRSPEPVQFVDLSTDLLVGDLPAENVVRIKIQDSEEKNTYVNDTLTKSEDVKFDYKEGQEIGVVTVVGQSFMAQYKIVYLHESSNEIFTNIEILPEQMQPLEFPSYQLSAVELRNYSMDLIKEKAEKPKRKKKALGLKTQLNSIHTLGEYIFIDLTFKNDTNLVYDIDDILFSIDDKKIYKATNVQSLEVFPLYSLYNNKSFQKNYRNIYVFKKFTYPNNKVLNIRLLEKQISGRTVTLSIKYKDILNADTF